MMTIFCAALFFAGAGCKKDPTNVVIDTDPHLSLVAEDTTSTELFLRLSFPAGSGGQMVSLTRDTSLIFTKYIAGDTLIVDVDLLPNHRYVYSATIAGNTNRQILSVSTRDTTSHDIQWQVSTFGIAYSYLYDVAIVNDTLAYAVGEIYTMDSTGHLDNNAYNLLAFDGARWEKRKMLFANRYSGEPYPPLKSILVEKEDKIYLSDGGSIETYNGSKMVVDISMNALLTGLIRKIGANDEGNLYAIGYNGSIVYFNGVAWQQIQSGTTVNLNDIWCGSNSTAGQDIALIAASNVFSSGEMKLLRIKNSNVDSIPWPMQDRRISSVWFTEHSPIFTAGGGVFSSRGFGKWHEHSLPLIYTTRIRGTDVNDIWTVGDFGIVAHYNGSTWKVFDELRQSGLVNESVAVTKRLVIIVGRQNGLAYIIVGRR